MNSQWIIFSVITIAYIVILVLYFLRRSKVHEEELTQFLSSAKEQLANHKEQAAREAAQRVTKAMAIVKKVQEAAEKFEQEAQEEYERIVDDAKSERREILAAAKVEVEDLFKQADRELLEYRNARHREIEKNLVKLVIAVTEKVVEQSLSPEQHKGIIMKSLEEIKQSKSRS